MLAIGAVSSTSARIWVRSESGGLVRLRYWPAAEPDRVRERVIRTVEAADRTVCATIPAATEAALVPSTAYGVEAVGPDRPGVLGTGRFETAPRDARSAPDRFAVAFMSCHQPFTRDGSEAAHAAAMLAATDACIEEHSVKLVLTLGDQMYTDYPKRLSLFDSRHFESVRPRPELTDVLDASGQETRDLLHRRYRHFWNIDGWKRMHARLPCYPAIDDHEIVDNFGCNPDHDTGRWRRYIEGARAAYFDYQASRVLPAEQPPATFDYSVEYGPLAAYVFDLRSNRRVGESPRMLSTAQFEQFARFLDAHRDKQVLIIALSVPIVHLPRWAARAGHALTLRPNEDFADRWSTAGHLRDRNRILTMLREHQRACPRQQLFCLSGDIHIACAHRISWDDGTPPMTQLISSGITHRVGQVTQTLSKLSILANRRIEIDQNEGGGDVSLIDGEPPYTTNPYTRLNLGILELKRDARGRYQTRSMIYGCRGASPQCAFRTRWNSASGPG